MARLDGTGKTGASAATPKISRFAEIMRLSKESEVETVTNDQTEVALESIHRLPRQVRRYFDQQQIEGLAAEIRRDGIRSPLWVRPLPEGKGYELVAGERRYRAAQLLGLPTVPIRVFALSDQEALEASLIENMQRSDLSPLEETEGILELLSQRLQCSAPEAISLLNRKAHEDKKGVTDSAVRTQWIKVEEVFSAVGRVTPEAFRTHRLPLLNLPEAILEALRQGKLEYTKAKAIASVKDLDKRSLLLEETIAFNLTLREVQEHVRALAPQKADHSSIKGQLSALSKKAVNSKVLEDPTTRKKFESLLKQMESLLEG